MCSDDAFATVAASSAAKVDQSGRQTQVVAAPAA